MDPALRELLRASEGPPEGEVEAIVRLADPGAQLPGMRIVARFGPIVTCRLRRDAIVAVWQDPRVISVKAARTLGPEPEPLLAEPQPPAGDGFRVGDVRRPPGLTLTGCGVVVGIVDWHCGFDHVNFRRADGTTRLLALWDQRPGHGDPPQPYGYGTVFDAAAMDRALHDPDPYTALGYRLADAGHGTHVTDIAAGGGQAGPAGLATEAELVFVHLADRGTSGLADLGDSCRILEAVDFIRRTAGPRPWVINCSMGRHGGPHDARTLCELAFEWLLSAAPGRFLVLSTGNYFNKSIHACGRIARGETRVLRVVTDEADETPNELEIWYDGDDEFAVCVGSPTGWHTRWVGLCEQADIEEDGEVVGRIYHRCWDPNNHDHHIDMFLDASAPAGEWVVTLKALTARDGRFHAWVERDEACRHCQAHFVAADADPTTTTGTLANGHLPLTVGAYNAHSPRAELTSFTSAGTTRDGRVKPDLVAPGSGVLAARSSHHVSTGSSTLLMRMSGTSMAAPHVTGAVALCLQADPALPATQIRHLLQHSAIPMPEADPNRVGAGRLDVARLEAAVLARQRPTSALQHRVAQPSECRKEPAMSTFEAQRSRWAGLDADRLYGELVYPRSRTSLTLAAGFDIVALPGEAPRTPLQSGDLLVRVVRGYPRLGHVAVVSDPTLIGHDRLAVASGGAERGGPGFYATVTEDGPMPHTAADRFARLILDARTRMPDGQLLLRPTPGEPATPDGEDFAESEWPLSPQCIEILKGTPKTPGLKVAVVGGGFAGLMAARTLCREGVKVTVFEARQEVGGRVVSNNGKYSKDFSQQPVFSPGRITEFGAELVGSIHTRWCELAKEYGLALISRMDTDLYRGQQLSVKLALDKSLTMDEVRALDKAMDKVQFQIAQTASSIHDPSQPWLKDAMSEKDKRDYDNTSVADALKNKYGVKPGGRLWKAFEWLLANNNVKPLEQLNFLGLLCLVKGGQSGTIAGEPEPGGRDERLMGYWKELEIYRCADGCQTLALEMQKEATARGCEVRLLRAVTGLHLVEDRRKLKVQVASRRVLLPGYELEKGKPNIEDFDYVILAIPPTVWSGVTLTSGNTPANPTHTHHVALMDCGDAIKFFSNVGTRFWIRDKAAAPQAQGAAPMGGSPTLGLVWEGTDNQTQTGDQGIVLSVFAGGPSPKRPANEEAFKKELTKLYSNYPRHLQKKPGTKEDWTKFANWPQEPFIRTGYASPGRGQILTIGKLLHEPFMPFFGRLLFAGEHTEMGYFGYMEGALRSGERAAKRLIQSACTQGVTIPGEPTLTPASAPASRLAEELVLDQSTAADQLQTMQSGLEERGHLIPSIEEPESCSQIVHARHPDEARCCATHELGLMVEDRADALQILGRSDLFTDVTPTGNQKNALSALQSMLGQGRPAAQASQDTPAVQKATDVASQSQSGEATVTTPGESESPSFDNPDAGTGAEGTTGAAFTAQFKTMKGGPVSLPLSSGPGGYDAAHAFTEPAKMTNINIFDRNILIRDASQLFFFATGQTVLNSTTMVRTDPADPAKFQVRLLGRVCYPADPKTPNKVAGTTPVPVVAIVHGNHDPVRYSTTLTQIGTSPITMPNGSVVPIPVKTATATEVDSYLGYEYLQAELARNGIASISIDNNVANFLNIYLDSRANLFMTTLDEWRRQVDTDPTNPCHRMLDWGNVGFVGHSRGGEVVVRAAKINRARTSTNQYGVKAVCSLSPTDFTGAATNAMAMEPQDSPLIDQETGEHRGMTYLVVFGALDGDIKGEADGTGGPFESFTGTGFRLYDRASCAKAMVYVKSACHNRFNTKWGTEAAVIDTDPALLTDGKHQDVSRFYIGGFFRCFLGGEHTLKRRFTGDIKAPTGITVARQWSGGTNAALGLGEVRRIDTFENAANNEFGIARVMPFGSVIRFGDLKINTIPQGKNIPHQTKIVHADLTVPIPLPDVLVDALPFPLTANSDWHTFDFLLFRLGRWFDLNTRPFTGRPPHVRVSLKDDANTEVTVTEADFFPRNLPGLPFLHQARQFDEWGNPLPGLLELTFQRLETVRVPLALFKKRGLDLTKVRSLKISLEKADNTHVFLDSLEIVSITGL